MSADLPSWQAFDPSEGAIPEAMAAMAAGEGRPQIIALLMMPGIDARWGAEASVGIARAWGETGGSVLLSDLDLREPMLHEVLGHENGQGVSDILLYGVSVQHAAFASEKGSFLVATAGTPVADPEVVLAHPRWEAVTRGLRDSGVSALLHLPYDLPGASSVLAWTDHVVVFAADASGAEGVEGAIAVLGPPPDEVEAVVEVAEVVDVALEFDADEPVEAIDVPEDISDAVIEAVADDRDDAVEEATATEMPEEATGEVVEALAEVDSPDEPEAEEPAVVEEESHERVEEGVGDFAVDEPVMPAEEADLEEGGGFSFDDLDGGQYAHVDDAPTDEETSAFDATRLDDTAADPTVEDSPMEGLETMEAAEPMSVEGEPAEGDEGELEDTSHDDEPSFDVGDGLELEAPVLAVESPLIEPESAPVVSDDAFDGLEPGAGVFEVEGSSLADGVVAPGDASMMDGVEHGAGVAEQFPPVPADAEGDDTGVVDGGTEDIPVETPAVVEPASDESAPDEETEHADDGLQVQPERKMSGLDELERRRKWQERRRVLLTTVAALVVFGGGGYGLAFFGIVDVPGITPANRMSGAVPAPVQLDGEQPTTPIVSHSLLINAYRTFETPKSLVPTLVERLDGMMLFFYTPLEIDGRVQYVMFAGAAYSAVQADNLKEAISVVLDRQNPEDWLVRAMPYAFFFGEYDGAARVAARIEELAESSIPSYALRVDYADGRTALRVYAGAFANEFDARPMAAVISESGISDVPLIERRGRLPE